MDEVHIVTDFTSNLISRALKKILRKKLGSDIDLKFNEIKASVNDGRTHVHIDVEADLEKEELTKILDKLGVI